MNERLSLQDLTDLLAKKHEITKKDAEAFLRELIAVVTENIEANESVKIKDFGTFKLVKVNARKSVDVNTGEAIEIAAHYKLSFNPDKLLKEAVNRPFAHFESVVLEEGVTFDNIESEIEEEKGGAVEEDVTVEEEIAENIAVETPKATAEEVVESIDNETEKVIQPVGFINTDIPDEEMAEEIAEETAIEAVEPEPAKEDDKSEQVLSVPDDIISKIEEEAASRNVNIEDIVLVIEEDNKKEKNKENKAAEIDDENEEGDLLYEGLVPKRKGIHRRYITLGFFIILIVAGFVVGGLYFQEVATYLTDGPSEKEDITKMADLSAIEPSLAVSVTDSIAQETDSIAVSPVAAVHQQDQGNDLQAPPPPPVKEAKAVTPHASVNGALGIETVQPGHTLRNIAQKYYGNKSFWVYIYEENKDKIKNINNVPIGTKLTIPAPVKYNINPQDEASVRKARVIEEDLFKRAENK